METKFDPDESQLQTLGGLDPDAPVAALNLFQFNERAQYAPGDEEYGTVAAIMFFPSRRAFVEMLTDPAFQAVSRHRKAALANHCMLHLNGTLWATT